jgi:hypothetical protein
MAGLRTHLASAQALISRICAAGRPDEPEDDALRAALLAPGSKDAFFSGSLFPDCLYRGVHDDAAEAAHWRPFQEALVSRVADSSYVLSMMRFEERQARRYASFCLGVILHGAVDEPWHFDDPPFKSFLTEAREREGLSHGQVERYCDLFLLAEEGMPPWAPWSPELLVMDAFSSIGHRVGSAELSLGGRKMAAELALYRRLAPRRAPGLARANPWTKAHFMGDSFGGAGQGIALALGPLRAAAGAMAAAFGGEGKGGRRG